MKFICKIFSHKMYSINWDSFKFTVVCLRCGYKIESVDSSL